MKDTIKAKKSKKWMRFRHRIITRLAELVLKPYAYIKYGVKIERFRAQGKRQYLVLYNHQTLFDQFFVGMAFRGPLYYIASEDLFSNGFISSLLRFAVAPIPIKKQTTDVHAIMNCMRVAKEGGSIAVAPEGNRTYSGRPVHVNSAIAPLARKLGLPVAIFRIEGGYGVHPRWSDVVRKGKMRAYVSKVIEPEEYNALDNDAFYARILEELNVDEASVNGTFVHPKRAEYLERAMYVCPDCGLSEFESCDDAIVCKRCGCKALYTETKELVGVGKPFPFRFVADWYDYQCDFVRTWDPLSHTDAPLYRESASLSSVHVYQKKELLREKTAITLYGDRICFDEGSADALVFRFDEMDAFTVLGKNKLNIYHGKELYQVKGDKRFNALKYVNLFYRYKNVIKGEEHEQFLGL